MPAPTLGLALIARDEEETLPALLDSLEGAFDQVVLAIDTASTDATADVFTEWAEAQHLPLGYKLEPSEWHHDFARARNEADALLDTDWLATADCDEVIVGADRLRETVAQAGAEVAALFFAYRFTTEPKLQTWRARLVRRGSSEWHGRVHDNRTAEGHGWDADDERLEWIEPEVAHWVHVEPPLQASHLRRNAEILRRWIEDEPENPSPIGMLATQEYIYGDRDVALDLFARHVEIHRPRRSSYEHSKALWALRMLDVWAGVEGYSPGNIAVLLDRPAEEWFSASAELVSA